jgi:uncharacterized coiled-coil protein SlyX
LTLNQPELDAQTLVELKAKINGLPILVAEDSASLSKMRGQVDALTNQLSTLKDGMTELSDLIPLLISMLNDAEDTQKQVLDLLKGKLKA